MCANWVSLLSTLSFVAVASTIIILVQSVPHIILGIIFLAWVLCFGLDALYTLKFGKETVLRREANIVFRAMYRRIGSWAVLVHFGIELCCVATISIVVGRISEGALGMSALAAGSMVVLAGEHTAAYLENRAFARAQNWR